LIVSQDISSSEDDLDDGGDGWSEDWETTWRTICLLTPEYAAKIIARKREFRVEQWLTSLEM
jgi:hypothetical protein